VYTHPVEKFMKKYEMVREIFNSCAGNQTRDISINEVETDDVESVLKEYLIGTDVTCEKSLSDDGAIIFDIDSSGLQQRISFTEI
jgi:hypothetical protein